jgi:two-component system cell cycle response regulator
MQMTKNARILVIDDDPIIRLTMESLLADSDVDLIFAENGKQGLEFAQRQPPDAILLDIMMPDMDGYEVCRRIRALPDLAEVPIIIVSALDTRISRLAGLDAGADDFLTKPFDSLEIKIRIQNILRLNRYRSLVSERARFLWMVEQSEDGYLILSKNLTIQYANQRAQTLLQLSANHLNIGFMEQIKLHYQAEPADCWDKWAKDPLPGYLIQPETSTAHAFWILVNAVDTPLSQDDYRVVRLQEITDKIIVDQDIRKFHILVTHKLRTPVSQLFDNMTMLKEKMDAFDEATVKTMVQASWKGSERLVQEVREVLDYIDAPLSLQTGQMLNLGKLPDLVPEVAKILGISQISVSIPDNSLSQRIPLSQNVMELILFEILGNAHKFHPKHNPEVEVGITLTGEGQICMKFSDNGLSLTAKQLQWALLPYFQGEKNFTGEVPGMGLGLPMVASLIWQVGGQIRLTNRDPGPGLQVELILPPVEKKKLIEGDTAHLN